MSMQDDSAATPQSVRNYEKRLHRHRQLYWRTLLPVLVVLVASVLLGFPMHGILLAILGVLIALGLVFWLTVSRIVRGEAMSWHQ